MTVCPICGNDGNKESIFVKGYCYKLCGECRAVCQDPIPCPDELEAFYGAYRRVKNREERGYLTQANLKTYQEEKKMTLKDLGYSLPLFKGKHLLEIGCANGPFLSMAGDLGAVAFGVDISEDLVAEARKLGLNCRVARIEEVSGSYDIICLWDVLEHIHEPYAFFENVRRLSRPGTHLFIQTPCFGRIAELFREEWRYFLPIEHVIIYSLASLTYLLKQFGFNVRSWVSFGSGNTSGKIQPSAKRVFDTLVKETGHGDTMAVFAEREA